MITIKPYISSFVGAFFGALVAVVIGVNLDSPEVLSEVKVAQNSETNDCLYNTKYLSTLNGKKVCELKGVYTQDLKLTSNFYWALNGEVVMGGDNSNNVTLSIEPGTTIYGSHGPDFLLISRGSKIIAKGNKLLPIIFTSAQDVVGRADEHDRGEWGGLVIAGNAPTNSGLEESFEFSKSDRKFGGSDKEDNSGVLKYVLVKYAGYEVSLDKELNGISLGGVGSKTLIDYVEVYNNADDGIELWGGTVNMKHIILVGNGDDGLDIDHGYQGKIQYLYIKQTELISYDPRGIEADGQKRDFEALPLSSVKIANFELHGNAEGENGIMLRRGSRVDLINGSVDGFGKYCLAMRNQATFRHKSSFNSLYLNGCLKGEFGAKSHVSADDVKKLLDQGLNNTTLSSPKAMNVNEQTQDRFFDEASFIGAFDKHNNWTKTWSIGVE